MCTSQCGNHCVEITEILSHTFWTKRKSNVDFTNYFSVREKFTFFRIVEIQQFSSYSGFDLWKMSHLKMSKIPENSKFRAAKMFKMVNALEILSVRFYVKWILPTLENNEKMQLIQIQEFCQVSSIQIVRGRSWVRILTGAYNFFLIFLLRFSSRRLLVAKIYPKDVMKCFCTLKLGLETVIFELQLLSTTEMVYLSWKFHLALVLTMPGS